MIKNKKAIFFSLISLFAVMVFVVLFSSLTFQEKEQSGLEVTRTRITASSAFVKDFDERYLERLLTVSSTFAMEDLSNWVVVDNSLNNIGDLEEVLKEILTNGLLPENADAPHMGGFTFPAPTLVPDTLDQYEFPSGLIKEINDRILQLGLQFTTFKIKEITLSQNDPWKVKAKFTLEYTIEEATGLASWRFEESIKEVEINIVGMKAGYDTSGDCCDNIGDTSSYDEIDNGALSAQWKSMGNFPNFLNRLIKQDATNTNSGICYNGEQKNGGDITCP